MSSVRATSRADTDLSSEVDPLQEDIPTGYRQAIVTGMAVMLTFTLAYVRFIAFDAGSGPWTLWGRACFGLAGASALVQLFGLWRALQLADDNRIAYSRTVGCLGVGLVLMVASLAANMVAESV